MSTLPDPGSVKVYTVNGAPSGSSSSLPDWLTRKRAIKDKGKRGAIKEQVEGTLELVQSFEFPEASNRIKTTRDGHHAVATGTYKPQMKVWDLDQLSQKFERHSDAENVDFIVSKSCVSSSFLEAVVYLNNPPSRCCQMTGQNPYISKMTVRSRFITRAGCTTALEYHALVVRSDTTSPRATP